MIKRNNPTHSWLVCPMSAVAITEIIVRRVRGSLRLPVWSETTPKTGTLIATANMDPERAAL